MSAASALDPNLKRIYAAILRLRPLKYFMSSDFSHLLLELDLDGPWGDCMTWAQRQSNVMVLASGYTGYHRDALVPFIDHLARETRLDETLAPILADYINWAALDGDSSTPSLDNVIAAVEAGGYKGFGEKIAAHIPPTPVKDLSSQHTSIGRAILQKFARAVVQSDQSTTKQLEPMTKTQLSSPPKLFIGSSVEGLEVARALQAELDFDDLEATVWTQADFELSKGTLESLVKVAEEYDFAVLILTPDDIVQKREDTKSTARDNVIFELGFFFGALGRERTFYVHSRDVEIDLPSDLNGVTPTTFRKRSDGNLRAALGKAASDIRSAIKRATASSQ